MINPRPAPLVLTDGERARLAAWARDPSAGPLAQRARIVLACADGPPGPAAGRPVARVAAELGLSRDTVRKWRRRFLERRLEGLVDGLNWAVNAEQIAAAYAPAREAYRESGAEDRLSLGTEPWRAKFRTPSYANLAAMQDIMKGTMVADAVAILGSIDVVMPEIDR